MKFKCHSLNFTFMFRGRLNVKKAKNVKNYTFFCNFLKNTLIWNLKKKFWCKMKFTGHPLNSMIIIEGRLHVKNNKKFQKIEIFLWRRPLIIILSSRCGLYITFYIRKHFVDFRPVHFSGSYKKKGCIFLHFWPILHEYGL